MTVKKSENMLSYVIFLTTIKSILYLNVINKNNLHIHLNFGDILIKFGLLTYIEHFYEK